jgi:LPXTG-site transpeptidase (sortase) family protein
MKSGVVYKPGEERPPVKIAVYVLLLKLLAKILSFGGLALIITSVFGLIFVYIPLGMAEAKYAFSKTQLAELLRNVQKQDWQRKETDKRQMANIGAKKPDIELPDWAVPDKNYSIYIPKIFAVAKVIPRVDVSVPKIYLAALKQGVAEADGLSHPGAIGTTFLFAHSVGSRVDFARYNAVFYLLDKLTFGDKVEIMYQGKLYKYEVVEREILAANDVKYLVPQELSEKLVLQTCYPPGTTWKRLVVVAKRQ